MRHDRILLAHGSGGRLMHRLIDEMFIDRFEDPLLSARMDSAVVATSGHSLAFTTDSFVVKPLFFPGGDIGRLAVCGTVNDLAVSGATPVYVAVSLILEEGLPTETLSRVVASMKSTADEAGVRIVAGDTKVVEKGAGDEMFVTTSGIGFEPASFASSAGTVTPGDAILVSGTLGDHEVAVLSQREGVPLRGRIRSDCAPMTDLVRTVLAASSRIRWMRDPTRGGLATTLNEMARQCAVGAVLQEEHVPIREEVRGFCEISGLDPLYMANEGKIVLVVSAQDAHEVLEAMRSHEHGRNAAIIGVTSGEGRGAVRLRTCVGGTRILDMLAGEQVPRIC